ncbi:hypothetical protein [Nitrosopumilus sp. b2]|uniref:hypothetical protein n=1 Tax=Nitrosopumilus sp. b2 TaxID=2109908 RepID=UPI0015F71E07|nr:hypothetical protein [Nitrosopumilus sp. b2]KAF6245001.1 hypothetical protein C6989_05495 [Nitrosopumilus sp. b2]
MVLHFRPLNAVTQIVLICVIVISFLLFSLYTFYPNIVSFMDVITESSVVIENSVRICVVKTDDPYVETKIINDCDLPAGTEAEIFYNPGDPYAYLLHP